MKKIVVAIIAYLFATFFCFGQKELHFDNIGNFQNGYAIVRKERVTSFIDSLGNELEIRNINLKNKEGSLALLGVQKNGFFINKEQKASSLSGKEGIRNLSGKYIVSPQYHISTYNGLYVLKDMSNLKHIKYEVLDENCKSIFKISGNFGNRESLIPLSKNVIAIFQKDSRESLYKLHFIDSKTETDFIYNGFGKTDNGLIVASKYIADEGKFKWGIMDEKGRTLIDFIYTYQPGNFSNGLAVVKNAEGKIGYINKNNQFVIEPKFIEAYKFINNKALVRIYSHKKIDNKINNGYRVIDTEGRILYDLGEFTPNEKPYDYYNRSIIESNDIIRLTGNKSKKVLLDLATGKMIETEYSSINSFDSGLALVSFYLGKGKYGYGYINKKGEMIFISSKKSRF